MDTRLCVEIRVPLLGGGNEFSSGYVVSTNRVLCCRHGLFPDNRDPDGDIQLAWRNEDLSLSGSDQVSRGNILWANKEADLAVLEWEHGDQLQAVPRDEAEIHGNGALSHVTQWVALGFLGSEQTDDRAGQPRLLKPDGQAKTGFDPAKTHYLTCGAGSEQPEQGEHWGGFSGSPVFDLEAKKVIGVVTHWDEPMGPKSLRCTLLGPYLQSVGEEQTDLTLDDALKLKAPDDLAFVQDWFVDRFVAGVRRASGLEQVLRQAYQPFMADLNKDTELGKFTQALLADLNPEQRVDGLENAFNQLIRDCDPNRGSKGHCDRRALAGVGQLAGLMLVLVFEDFSVVRKARLDIEAQDGLLAGHSWGRLDTEALLAAVDGAPPSVEVLQGRLIYTYDLTADPDRQGRDIDGWQGMSDFTDEVLANTQSGEAAYLGGLDPREFRGMEAELTAIGEGTTDGGLSDTGFYSLTRYADRIAFVAERLRRAAGRHSRNYYVHLNSSDGDQKTRLWTEFRRLSNNSLILVKTSGEARLSLVNLITVLQDIIIKSEQHSQ